MFATCIVRVASALKLTSEMPSSLDTMDSTVSCAFIIVVDSDAQHGAVDFHACFRNVCHLNLTNIVETKIKLCRSPVDCFTFELPTMQPFARFFVMPRKRPRVPLFFQTIPRKHAVQDFVSTVFHNFGAFSHFVSFFCKTPSFCGFRGVVCFIPSCFPVLPEPVSYIVPRRCETLRGAAPKPRRHFENVGQTTTAQTAQARFTCYSPQVSSHPAGTIRPGIARACRARRRARTKDVARIAWT